MLGLSSSSSALSVPPLHTPVPTGTAPESRDTRLAGRGGTTAPPAPVQGLRQCPSASPPLFPCPTGTVQICPAVAFAASRRGGGQQRKGPPMALGGRAEVGSPAALSVWPCTRGAWRVSVCAHACGTPCGDADGMAHSPVGRVGGCARAPRSVPRLGRKESLQGHGESCRFWEHSPRGAAPKRPLFLHSQDKTLQAPASQASFFLWLFSVSGQLRSVPPPPQPPPCCSPADVGDPDAAASPGQDPMWQQGPDRSYTPAVPRPGAPLLRCRPSPETQRGHLPAVSVPACPGLYHLLSSSSSWFTLPGRENYSLIANLLLPH